MKKTFVIFSILIGIAVGILYALMRMTHTVVLTKNGFEPSKLTVFIGSSVRFRSSADRVFWPASNYHPTHGIYPAFDPKKEIGKGETWTFRFSESGEWEYHDHTAPKYTGTIRVIDPFGLVRAQKNPCRNSNISPSGNVNCAIRLIRSKLESGGLTEALAEFNRLYMTNSSFAANCHDVAHVVGEAGYRQFVQKPGIPLTPETSYCGYGFYHGFIEALLKDGYDFKKARSMCESVQESLEKNIQAPQGKNSCYHGVGHGAFDAVDTRRWGDDRAMVRDAVSICREFVGDIPQDDDLFRICTTGVFNALAIAYQNNSYALAFDRNNPLGICREQPELLQKGCFMELGVSFARMSQMDRGSAISFFRRNNSAKQSAYMIFAFIADELRITVDNPQQYKNLSGECRNLNGPERTACVEGIAHGLLTWGIPTREWERLNTFCSDPGLLGRDRAECFAYMLTHIKNLYSAEKVKTICSQIPSEYRMYCTK